VAVERVDDHLPLGVRERHLERTRGGAHGHGKRQRRPAAAPERRQIGHADERTTAEKHGPFHGMLELANIARPVVREERGKGRRREALHQPAGPG